MIEIRGKHNQCKVFTDNVDNETISQLTALLNQESVSDSQIRIMPDCFTEDIEVLTTRGFVPIKDLSFSDKVANYDINIKKVFFEEPLDIIKRPLRINEKVYDLYCKQSNFHITATENHRILTKDGVKLMKDISDISVLSDYIYFADGIDNKVVCNSYTDLEIMLICWVVGDGSFVDNGNGSIRVKFSFKKERKINRVLELLNSLNLNYNHSNELRGDTSITINVSSSRYIINLLGGKKEFPLDFIFLNSRQADIFLNELIQVDGDYTNYIRSGVYRFNSKSKTSIDIVQAIMCLNNNYSQYKESYKINYLNGKETFIYYLNKSTADKVSYSRSGFHSRKITKSEMNYTGYVYCLTCSTSYFIARQNGLAFITGNCHSGKGCVIGTTMTLTDKVIPNLVGVDIGCGILVVKLKERRLDLPKLDSVIRKYVPSGFNIHKTAIADSNIYCMECAGNVDIERAYRSLGTLGGGNHFIEVDKDKNGDLYLVIHTGSRHLGIEVCNYYQNKGYEALKETNLGGSLSDLTKSLVSKLKSEGRDKEISKAIKSLKESYNKNVIDIPQALAYVEGANFNSYLHDMKIVQEHASINRKVIANSIMKNMKLNEVERFETIHNYIDVDNMILRKGSVSAQLGEKLIIPMNMRDGSLICVGKGNSDWNYSAPHGAGRLMSRSKAKESVGMDEFKASMEGIYTTSVNRGTLDESPMAYKPMQEIIDNVDETVGILDIVKPVYNFKASE